MVNLLPLEQGEHINAVLPVREFDENLFIFMVTGAGTVKKTPLHAFSRPRANGIIALDLRGDDLLVGAAITDGSKDVILVGRNGKAIRFKESDVRAMGRTAAGVRGIRLAKGDEVISLIINDGDDILTATENGYGKRTRVDEFSVQGRGGQGVIAIQTSERNGKCVGALQANDEHQIMLISDAGTLVRIGVSEVSVLGRNTQGVRLIKLGESEKLVGLQRIEALADDEELEEDQEDEEAGQAVDSESQAGEADESE
jgi:DNA gyrase subunit A